VTSVVVPVYRNAPTVRELYSRLRRALAPHGPHQLIFVDDASPDEAARVLDDLALGDSSVLVIHLPTNQGQQQAILAGLARARGSTIVVMDADLQDPPEAIPTLVAALGDHASAVFAGRRGRYDGFGRLVTSRLFKALLQVLCGTPTDAGLFVAIDRTMQTRLLQYAAAGPSVLAMIGCTGLPLASVPCRRERRRDGASAYPWSARLSMGVRVLAWTLRARWRMASHG
jgi:polyisoprenyl-phosphate glycosyltransferase